MTVIIELGEANFASAADYHAATLEWLVECETTGPTPYVRATYWQPAEGGEVEVVPVSATCPTTGEALTYADWVERFDVSDADERRMSDAAEQAVVDDEPHAFVCVGDRKAA